MKYIKFIVLIIILMTLTGCWNYREIGDLAIVGGIGVDVDGDQYRISVEVLNVRKVANTSAGGGSSTSDESAGVVYDAKGHTIKEAMSKIIYECPKELFIGHLKLLVIGEEAAKKGVTDFLDYFTRATESRETFSVVVVEGGKAVDLLRVTMPIEPITSFNTEESLAKIATDNSNVSNRKLDELLMCLYQVGRAPTLTAVKITNSSKEGESTENLKYTSPKTSIVVSGSAIFDNDKLVGYINMKDSLVYTIIRNTSKSFNIIFKCDDNGNYGTVTVNKAKTVFKVDIKKNKPIGIINVSGDSALTGFNCKVDLRDEKNIRKMEKIINKTFKKQINKAIKNVQDKFKTDIFGFGERIYKDHNNYWKKVKDNWNEKFSTMKYNTKVNITIKSRSSTINSVKEG